MRGPGGGKGEGRRARLRAPAKVNLFLRVLERRPDGFHEVETLFQAVSLADEVTVTLGGPTVEEGEVRLTVDGPDLGPAEENLAVRAARAFREAAGMETGVALELRKEIPAGAGLGGGSSDAAAVLRALSALAGEPPAADRLHALAASLGSDVPFFLGPSPLAAARGRGERLTPLDPLPSLPVLLVLPPAHVATGAAYGALAAAREGEVPEGPELPGRPTRWSEVWAGGWNDFEEVVAGRVPEVARSLDALRAVGARGALLSGSGAACFAFPPGEDAEPGHGGAGDGGVEEARALAAELEAELGWPVRAARTLERFPAVEVGGEEAGTSGPGDGSPDDP